MTTRRPNILLVTSDQHRGDAFGFEGRGVRTPHLDLLASQGARFSACICPNVVCQPVRASILTGLLPLTHGVHDNGIDLDERIGAQGFAGHLATHGYATGFIGKAHFSTNHTFAPTGRPECVRSSADYADDWFGPYMGFDHVELMLLGHNWWLPERPPRGLHYERWYHRDGLGDLKDALYRTRLPPDAGAAQTHHSALPVAWHNSTWVADRTIEFIRAQARQSRVRPFCVWASFPDPHHPFDAPDPWSRMHDPAAIDLPVHRTRDLDRRPWWHRAYLEGTPQTDAEMRRTRETYSRIPPQADAQLRALIANYFGMIALIDHGVGRILAVLDELDLARDTLVVFTSDHGEWLGDHGLLLKGPMHYEGLLRVGLVMRGPGIPCGRVIDDPVSTIDLAATFADFAAVDPAPFRHSRSLRPLLDGTGARDHAYDEWYLLPARAGVELDLRTVRTRRHKLTLELRSGAGELYDLEADPEEMRNRFDDPAAAAVREWLVSLAMDRPDDVMNPLPLPSGAA